MFSIISRAGIAGVLTLAASAPALAAPGPVPVSVVSCSYEKISEVNDVGPGAAPVNTGDLQITFVNHSPLTATGVRFAVQYANRSQVVDASGTFSSDTSITKDFAPSANPWYNGSAACTVQSVTFSDGSTWQPG
ncbi:MAG: hypothetical protein QOJ39_847 [Candidatus Eremiobacteraeota bacterium]|jgi:hypothetical protein|nr:hypothetical protein [Candidatus Eremiobacteraeota bacterium]